jgi:hypothetical protein
MTEQEENDVHIKVVWQGRGDLYALMPEEWTGGYKPTLLIKMELDTQPAGTIVKHRSECLYKHKARPGYPTYHTAEVELVDMPERVRSDIYRYELEACTLRNKYEAITSQITALLASTKSLNALLKKFPDLALYIADEDMARVNKVVERTSKANDIDSVMANINKELLIVEGVTHALAK